jgi:type II secretory pathway component GspD/PulD (secretin)
MQRIIAAILVVALAVVCTGAQEKEPEKAPEGDGYVLRGATSGIPIPDLVMIASQYTKMVFIFHSQSVKGEITALGPREGFTVERDKFPLFLQTALEQYRLVMVKRGDMWLIVPMAEAVTYAPIVSEQELPAIEPWQWVSVHLALQNLEANSATGALRNFTSRLGGMVQPIPPSTIVICDRADRVVQLVKLAREMDAALQAETIRYPLPEGINAAEAAGALTQLFPDTRVRARTFAASPSGNAVLARSPMDDQELIAQAIKALQE